MSQVDESLSYVVSHQSKKYKMILQQSLEINTQSKTFNILEQENSTS